MNLDDALKTFVIESRELLEQMEDALLHIEQAPDDPDTINAIFRAAHTIKGSAGLFGLDHIVRFTHAAESVLDRVRAGEVAVDGDLAALFLQVCDLLNTLIDGVSEGAEPDADTEAQAQRLIGQLNVYTQGGAGIPDHTAPAPAEARRDGPEPTLAEADHWHLSLRFGSDVFRNGMDPLSFIRYLNRLGRIAHIVTLTDALPVAAEMDPETCYLGFEIGFESGATKAEIESVFEFVAEDSVLHILPPRSKISDYIELIRSLPEQEMQLGEILVRCGTLTDKELQAGLDRQAHGDRHPPPPIGEVLIEQTVVHPPVVEAALEKQQKVKEQKRQEASFIRVDAQKLDKLINLVGELIISSAATNLIAERVNMDGLSEATSTMTRLVEEVRDSVLSLRMVQIGATFGRFQRVVHDVSKELGKDIRLEISGEETELDKTVVEKIGDPLTHLVRNSMDHGIEPADIRLARGKPAYGTLKLNAYHDAGNIVIEVSDDGGGLNRDKILAKALERGLIETNQVLSDREIYALIFEPGFSTADQVSNLSGRGVGMDVVRRNIQSLRGTVDVDSEPGVGTTIRIRLPLTLAIIDGFMVGVAGSSYVLPLDTVVECIELTASDRAMAGDGTYLNLRGEVLPYLRLRDFFDVHHSDIQRENVVVVQYAGRKAGLVVDDLLGEFQTVIKPLGKVFSLIKGIGGFTILGNGEVALILDVPRLMSQVTAREENRDVVRH
jgi:two-component system chemotaxis sensor kinase CheA